VKSPSESPAAQWHTILRAIATHDFGVVQSDLPMIHAADGRTLRINEPPTGVVPRQAAVLILATPSTDAIEFVVTRRSGALRQHSGEIAFPGGRVDDTDESVYACALREAHEEIGVPASSIQVLGALHAVYVPRSNHMVTPVVAWLAQTPTYQSNPAEVAEVFHLPIHAVLGNDTLQIEERLVQGETIRVPYFPFREHRIWGATALMLCDLSARIDRCIAHRNSRHKESE
jgi:8-oxo-dGTP pyrophosphatase MutT (NUDIX family)